MGRQEVGKLFFFVKFDFVSSFDCFGERQGVDKRLVIVVTGGRDGAAGRPVRDAAARRGTGQPGRRPWSGAGVGQGNGATGSAVSRRRSGGGQGNNGTRVHGLSLIHI